MSIKKVPPAPTAIKLTTFVQDAEDANMLQQKGVKARDLGVLQAEALRVDRFVSAQRGVKADGRVTFDEVMAYLKSKPNMSPRELHTLALVDAQISQAKYLSDTAALIDD